MKRLKKGERRARTKRADELDAEVGRRVRLRRLECHFSQTDLADRIGVRFQQVQKYEKGLNRIGASRLQRISEALKVPISFFFEAAQRARVHNRTAMSKSIFGLMQTPGSIRIMKAFKRIKNRQARLLLMHLAEKLAEG